MRTVFSWAIENSYGEFVAGDYVIPLEDVTLVQEIDTLVDSDPRGASDARDYASIPTTGRANAEVGGIAYQEILGDLLYGIMGQREAYGDGYEYSVSELPPSFSIQSEDIDAMVPQYEGEIDPRLVHRYSGCMLKELEMVFSTQDAIRWKASFVGQGAIITLGFRSIQWAESEETWNPIVNARWDGQDFWGPGYSPIHPDAENVEWNLLPSETPLLGWGMDVFLGDEAKRENVSEISIKLSREEILHYTPQLSNPARVYLGPLEVTFDMVLLRDESTEEERYENKIQEKVLVICSSGGETLTFRASRTDFGDSAMEEDRSETGMQLTYHCRGLYNTDDSGPCIFRLA